VSHAPPRQPTNGCTTNYFIPNDNPFVGQSNVLEEFFCLGLRSPHRMTIDPPTGRIFIGDVGESSREEIDVIEPGESALNFQWNRCEGNLGKMTEPFIGASRRPVLDYSHSEGRAIIGGYVYRGRAFAHDLGGKYISATTSCARLGARRDDHALQEDPALRPTQRHRPNAGTDYTGLSSFGTDAAGELYLCQLSSIGGRIYKLQRGGPPPPTKVLPKLLSQTGAFTDLEKLSPADALIPYTVNSPLWSDGAAKSRWLAVPTNTASASRPPANGHSLPARCSSKISNCRWTTRIQTFSIVSKPACSCATRTAPFMARATNGVRTIRTPIWLPRARTRTSKSKRDRRTRAKMVLSRPSGLHHLPHDDLRRRPGRKNPPAQWRFQIPERRHGQPAPHVESSRVIRRAAGRKEISRLLKLAAVTDPHASPNLRVRSYLDANCAMCHRPGGAGAFFDARFDTPLAKQNLINGPVQNPLGINGAKAIAPGDTNKSVLFRRISIAGENQMPPLAKNVVDEKAVAAFAKWISALHVAPPSLPRGWSDADIGDVGLPGETSFLNGNFHLLSSGSDIWESADAFRFAFKPLAGDGQIIARIQSFQFTDPWAKAGVMLRENISAGRNIPLSVSPARVARCSNRAQRPTRSRRVRRPGGQIAALAEARARRGCFHRLRFRRRRDLGPHRQRDDPDE